MVRIPSSLQLSANRSAVRAGLGVLALSLVSLTAFAADTTPPAPPAAPAAPAAAAAPAPAADPGQQKVVVSEATAKAAAKLTCRTERVTGSNLRSRKVCSTPDSESASGDWVRQQQDRGALNASSVVNSGT